MISALGHDPSANASTSSTGGGSLVANASGHARIYQAMGDMTVIARTGAPAGPAVAPVAVQVDEDAVFVGRDEQLEELLTAFGEHRDTSAVVVSAGMGGVGKTALVTRAAARAVEQGLVTTAVVLNLNGYDPDPAQRVKPRDVLGPLLRLLGLPDEQVPATVPEQLAAYRALLAAWERQGRRLLLVLDNAGDADQVTALLPPAPHVAVVTTRDTLTLPGRTRHLDLDTLPMTDAVDLLTQLLHHSHPNDPRADDGAALVRLADQCDRLPLALEIAAAVLADEPSTSAADFAGELTAAPQPLDSLQRADRSVAAVLELSWHRLSERHPEAAELLSLLPIDPGPDLSTGAAAALVGIGEAQVKPRLRVLRHAHLLQLIGGRWRMHDLVRQHARTHLTDQQRNPAVRRLLEHYDRLADAADAHLRALPDDSVPDTFPGRAEALNWFDTERANLTSAVALALDTGHHHLTTHLAAALSEYLSWRRHLADWVTVSEHALAAAQHLNTSRTLAIASNNLGAALREVRRFDEAITHLQQAAAIFRETADRHGEGQALGNLGNVLREVRRFDEAITHLQQAAAIFRETADRHGEGQALTSLGNVLREVGRFDEAITHLQQAAAIFRETADPHGEGDALSDLGLALWEGRRFDEATSVHQQAAALFRETRDPHSEGRALNNLGIALQKVRRFDEAITAHEQAAALFRETADRQDEGSALNNLGNALRQVWHIDYAITVQQRAAALFREAGERRHEGIALRNLGNAFCEAGRLVEAAEAWTKALPAFEEAGDSHSVAAVTERLGTLQ
ncbi:tetratricopeptide repeat protein [Amycolatopsis sp. 195334CR]|uniref:tetratricopeptide repeat protein n=1 Tax=Amycolatopsis sp. 195334CR TaxID=2814588 RepID=UPI001A903C6F|nr:tetratricopeptide repeat protein [Amycolatopsis sp. 195334CR]MBN6040043.1 tetratricopeptide repeat protein [Amycolatopsis sp. 195334CR]